MSTNTLTLTAREVRPGDIMFGMVVETNAPTSHGDRVFEFEGLRSPVWTGAGLEVTIERPIGSAADPVGTVRADFSYGVVSDVYLKNAPNQWFRDSSDTPYSDVYVDDLVILWRPGMPIPEGVQA